MTARERGFLLLTGYLGMPERKPLTTSQYHELTQRIQSLGTPAPDQLMTREYLLELGYDHTDADQILNLLSQGVMLDRYLDKSQARGCYPLTPLSEDYPVRLLEVLGSEAPGILWYQGDPELLKNPGIALVGCRQLMPENEDFAREAGKQAALQGYTLISGNAQGADRTAQNASLFHGGTVISIVADELVSHRPQPNMLYFSEEGFDLRFTAWRALQRNRIIHALGQKVLVAQCHLGIGGTWNGTNRNLTKKWSPVFCYQDHSEATRELVHLGATAVDTDVLSDLGNL